MSTDRPDQDETSGTTRKKPSGSNTAFIAIAFPFLILGITQMSGDSRGAGIAFFGVGITFLILGLTSGTGADGKGTGSPGGDAAAATGAEPSDRTPDHVPTDGPTDAPSASASGGDTGGGADGGGGD